MAQREAREQERQQAIVDQWKQEAWARYRTLPGATEAEFEQLISPPPLGEHWRRIAAGEELSPDEQAVADELAVMLAVEPNPY